MMSTIDTAPFWPAKDGGYFEREGLDVSTTEAATGQASRTAGAVLVAENTGLLTVKSTLDARQLRRVPDLLLKTGVLAKPVDVSAMVVR
jgi:hypothetical protein